MVDDVLGDLIKADPNRGSSNLIRLAPLGERLGKTSRHRSVIVLAGEMLARPEPHGWIAGNRIVEIVVVEQNPDHVHALEVVGDRRRPRRCYEAPVCNQLMLGDVLDGSGQQGESCRADRHEPVKLYANDRRFLQLEQRREQPDQALQAPLSQAERTRQLDAHHGGARHERIISSEMVTTRRSGADAVVGNGQAHVAGPLEVRGQQGRLAHQLAHRCPQHADLQDTYAHRCGSRKPLCVLMAYREFESLPLRSACRSLTTRASR